MALIGGGGAGNVGGGNPSGTGTSVNYIGEHAYGYSGTVAVSNSDVNLLDFSTPSNSYIVGKVQFFGLTLSNDDIEHSVIINGEKVITVISSQTVGTSEPDSWIPVLLPPQSTIKITGKNAQSGTSINTAAIFVGRVYG